MGGHRSTRGRGRCRARRGGGGRARAGGGAGRVLRRYPHQPLPPGIDRDARAAGPERVAVDQLRPRPARAGERRLGLRRDQPRRAGRGPRGGRTGRRHCPRQRGAGVAQGGARQRRQGGDHLDERLQARSVRRAARHQDRVSDEAERNGAGRRRASASSARRCCSSTNRSSSPRAKARASRSGWCAPTRSSAPPPPTAPAATFRPAPSSIARNWSATNTSRTTRGCATPRRPATRWSRS